MAQAVDQESKSDEFSEFVQENNLNQEIGPKLRAANVTIADLYQKSEDEINEFVEALLQDEADQNALKKAILSTKPNPDQMTINIKTLAGQVRSFDVKKSLTVWDLKKDIESKEGIAAKQIKLLYSGQELNDKSTLEQCNIEDSAVIFLQCTNKSGCIVM